ncbi:hypothetical protein A2950_00045 [Candidatus Kaiserbacteria bacterium RIFCSPLOWO2_01_FULL_55_19]|uniref:Uncharacterized protein n=1 Tax=Candidatus Kaiserbacteria bacterium RIFCSPLOWO2_01_FULL_55_19 TaxID=1798516 RepID=A0A1F6ES08_9BACT|nr:MAG: hypothetical protein A2950_00045 [Candidatus Kaiserbacteria bacterium RIFCSPLOWO2_01_FULL_55_19]
MENSMTTTIYPESGLNRITSGFGISAVITLVASMLLTIMKESYPPLLSFMKSISILGVKHHWLVHGLAIVILFYLLGWLFSSSRRDTNISGASLATILAWATVLSSLGIFGFYLMELFK